MNLDRVEWPQDYLDDLNAILRETDGTHGYRVGAVDAYLIQETGKHPTRAMLRAAAAASSLSEALRLARSWVAELRRPRRYTMRGERRP